MRKRRPVILRREPMIPGGRPRITKMRKVSTARTIIAEAFRGKSISNNCKDYLNLRLDYFLRKPGLKAAFAFDDYSKHNRVELKIEDWGMVTLIISPK